MQFTLTGAGRNSQFDWVPDWTSRPRMVWANLAHTLGYSDGYDYDDACESHPEEVRARLAAL